KGSNIRPHTSIQTKAIEFAKEQFRDLFECFKEKCEKQFLLPSGILCNVSCKKLAGFKILYLLSSKYKRKCRLCQFIAEKNTRLSVAYFLLKMLGLDIVINKRSQFRFWRSTHLSCNNFTIFEHQQSRDITDVEIYGSLFARSYVNFHDFNFALVFISKHF